MSNNPHDGLFKFAFSQVEHVEGELRAVLPPSLAARLDFTTLELCPGSFIDEAFRWRHTDLLFTSTFGGRPALVYLLFEHQSTVDPQMPFRLLRYMVRIWEAHLAKHPDATNQLTVDEIKELIARSVGEDVEEEIVTLADRLREEGRLKGEQKGRIEGEQKGALDGRREILLKLLTVRFGKLPAAAVASVNGASVEQLETWAERVLTAPTLGQVIDAS